MLTNFFKKRLPDTKYGIESVRNSFPNGLNFMRYSIAAKIFLSLIPLLLLFACSSNKTVKETDVFEPDAAFKKANDLIKRKYYNDAREILEGIKSRDASQKYAALAKIRIADTYFEDEAYEEAVVEYENFLDVHPRHKYSSYAQYMLATSFFKRIKTIDVSYSWAKRAMQEFQKLRRIYPRNPYMDITESRIKTCKLILAEYEFYVGRFYFKKGSYEAAVNRFNELLENYPDSKMESEALYYLGLSYENMGQNDRALNILTALIKKFPSIEISMDAKEVIDTLDEKK